MTDDFLKELEHLGITARLKRVSDTVTQHIRELYASEGLDIEPSWHLVFRYLKKHKIMPMTDIAIAFNMSLPAIFKMINKMQAKGYVEIIKDEQDKRKKKIKLSKKAISRLPKFEKVWNAGQQSMKDVLKKNPEFLSSLEKFEDELQAINFKERALGNLKK